jgi:hypothetical protein
MPQEKLREFPAVRVEIVNELPDSVVKTAKNIISDSRKAILVGLIPILGLAFIGRLIEWYLLRRKCPTLATAGDAIAKNFRSALPRLWFAALLWPIVILVVCLCVVAG